MSNEEKIQVIVDLLQALGTPYVLSVGHGEGENVTLNYAGRGDTTTRMLGVLARAVIHGDGLDDAVIDAIPVLVERINSNILKESIQQLQPNEVN